MATPDEERLRLVQSARSICWEAYGVKTQDLNDLQCLIRAAERLTEMGKERFQELGGKASEYLDLAEEMAEETGP